MICDKCGRDIPDDSKFCTFCGDKKTPAPQEEPTNPPAPQEEAVDSPPATPQEEPTNPPAPQEEPTNPPAAPQGAPFTVPQQDIPNFSGEQASGTFAPPPAYPDPQYSAGQQYPGPGAQYPDPSYSPNPQYPGAQYPAPPEPPKKKKTWIIVVVIIAILLCCVAPIVTGVVLYNIGQNAIDTYTLPEAYTAPTEPYIPDSTLTPPKPNPDNVKSLEGAVLVDSSSVKITLGTGEENELLGWYELDCTVENKTNKILFLYFDYDTKVNGKDAASSILLYPATDSVEDFPANAKTPGTVVFLEPPSGMDISTLKGTLIVVDIADYDTVEEISFNLSVS